MFDRMFDKGKEMKTKTERIVKMKKYVTVLTTGEWKNGSGWSYDGSLVDTTETDSADLNGVDWVETICLNQMDEDELRKMADADEKDVLWTFTTYRADDYEENGTSAEEVASAKKWQSEAAEEQIMLLRSNTKGEDL